MKNKTAILIGYGGMGKRYFKALKFLKIKVLAICDKRIDLKKNFENKKIIITNDYKKLAGLKADLLCVATNTKSRYDVIKFFCQKSKINKIITEKPLSTSVKQSKNLKKIVKNNNKKFLVNTHRTLSPNFLSVKKFFKKNKEVPTSIFINSPSAGLGNMGSTFFDIGYFFLDTKPISIFSKIDKSNTINPRGKQFKDPGGYGIINFAKGKKLFFDLSENTGLPYTITIKSKNIEVFIDELNNEFKFKIRPKKLSKKPLYYYLFKPKTFKMKLKHKFDVVKMTSITIKKIFEKKSFNKNLENSITSVECIIGAHISDREKKVIYFPLNKRYHNLNINFA